MTVRNQLIELARWRPFQLLLAVTIVLVAMAVFIQPAAPQAVHCATPGLLGPGC